MTTNRLEFIIILTLIFQLSCDNKKVVNQKNNFLHTEKVNSDSLYKLGKSILMGDVSNPDYQKAYELLAKASELGNKNALAFFGCELLNGGVNNYFKRDEVKGKKLLLQAIRMNSTEAMNCMALYYYKKNDIIKCLELMERSEKGGDIFAAIDLGYLYYYGQLPSYPEKQYEKIINKEKGLAFIVKSAENGNLDAQLRISTLYINDEIDSSFISTQKVEEYLNNLINSRDYESDEDFDLLLKRLKSKSL